MRYSFYDDPSYRKRQADLTKQYAALHPRVKKSIAKICANFDCSIPFEVTKQSDPKMYCSRSCSASINNRVRKRFKKIYHCLNCNYELKGQNSQYCSVKCQNTRRFNLYISRWKTGLEDGSMGVNTKGISRHIRRFLLEKFRNKCSRCNWNKIHPKTLVVPLEINHIDGNAENNLEENLELICPNCHALTPNFRNLNKGKGRKWRLTYIKLHKKSSSAFQAY